MKRFQTSYSHCVTTHKQARPGAASTKPILTVIQTSCLTYIVDQSKRNHPKRLHCSYTRLEVILASKTVTNMLQMAIKKSLGTS